MPFVKHATAVATIALVGLVVSCGDSAEQKTTTSPLRAAPTATTAMAATTMPAATTVAASTTAEAATTTTTEAAEVWDLLYISDSAGFGVAELYAERAERELGVEVDVHDETEGFLRAVEVLERIRQEGPSGWADLVREAEIIVMSGNPDASGHTSDSFRICVMGSAPGPPSHFTEEDWQPYGDVLSEIFAEIWRLREGMPVVLRTVDVYHPPLALNAWREVGIEAECAAALRVESQTIRDAAEANGATMVSTREVFNGPQHDEEPREGYFGPDGIHTTEEGAAVIADALAAVGFEPATKPKSATAVEGPAAPHARPRGAVVLALGRKRSSADLGRVGDAGDIAHSGCSECRWLARRTISRRWPPTWTHPNRLASQRVARSAERAPSDHRGELTMEAPSFTTNIVGHEGKCGARVTGVQ